MDMVDNSCQTCVVLVTGGSGFLGQHVIKLLQEKAMHVTEIRVLDMVPFVQKLDYRERVLLTQYTGSINNLDLVHRACEGVACVIHLVALIDVTMFPNHDKLHEINVTGTDTVVRACQQTGVQRLMYCSSVDVAVRRENIEGESGDHPVLPETIAVEYARTKHMAEQLVINANGPNMTTLVIRPATIYGDGDQIGITAALRLSTYSGTYRKIHLSNTKHQAVYVGNVAWMYVCAEIRMHKISLAPGKGFQPIGRHVFLACDDTPVHTDADLFAIFQEECGLRREKPDIPAWLTKFGLYFLMFILTFVRLFKNVNIMIGPQILNLLVYAWWFNYEKATHLLGYKPLFDWPESKRLSLEYYKGILKKN